MPSSTAAGALAMLTPTIAFLGVIATLWGKWYLDKLTERRKAAAELSAALAELQANVEEIEKLKLKEAFEMYRENAKNGHPIPLIVPLPEDMFPLTKQALRSSGALGSEAASTLASVHFAANSVVTTMKTLQHLFDAGPGSSVATLDSNIKLEIIADMFGLAARQVDIAVARYRASEAQLHRVARKMSL